MIGAEASWYEATARQRIAGLVDAGSFTEFLGPASRELSPHLAGFDLPRAFDDGMIVGQACLDGQRVLLAAQEGQFMGGAIGEVHGAKLTGLLRGARDVRNLPVLILFDTGGVRLQEANAGELAVAEIMRALLEARTQGVRVIGLIGGRAGCFGGGSLIAACCCALAISEQGRLSVSGPEVIETNRGVEEFDSRDRPLVWRTMGGKNRRLLGGADLFVGPAISNFRTAALALLARPAQVSLPVLEAENARLAARLGQLGQSADATEAWSVLGVPDPAAAPQMSADEFIALARSIRESLHDAR
jgi:malonate decarboxylase beta subunit